MKDREPNRPRKDTPPLSDSTIGRITAATSHEGKAAVLLRMKKGRFYSKPEFTDILREEGDDALVPPGTVLAWGTHSLERMGLIKEETDDNGTIGFSLTEEGNDRGIPYVGQALMGISEKHEASLHVLGSASSKGLVETGELPRIQPTIHRLRIFSLLLEHEGPVSEQYLLQALKDNYPTDYTPTNAPEKTLQNHLTNLKKMGIITHGPREDDSQEVFTSRKQKKPTQFVSIKPEQRPLLQDILTLVENFRQEDPAFMEDGRRKAEQLAADHERLLALVQKGRDASPHKRRKD